MAISLGTVAGGAIGTTIVEDTALSTTAQVADGNSGTIHQVYIDNTNNSSTQVYVKGYDTTGSVTVGTTHPDFVFPEVADIVKLPEISYVTRSSDDAIVEQPLAFLLMHEFDDLRKGGLEFKLENVRKEEIVFENVEPQWVEMSRARWVIRISNVGKYRFTVSLNREEINSALFYAYKD